MAARQRALAVLFFVSGFAALLYQIVWQRTLFAIYGINVESVTIVVTAFMLGLGLGSLAGGRLSADPTRPVVLLFAVIEGGIGLFGFVSLQVFHAIGELTLRASYWTIALMTLLMVLAPTMLMGATLPLLVADFTRRSRNVGTSVGTLYHANTLGSALASLVAVLFLLGFLGQTNTVRLAAVLNLTCASCALLLHRSRERRA